MEVLHTDLNLESQNVISEIDIKQEVRKNFNESVKGEIPYIHENKIHEKAPALWHNRVVPKKAKRSYVRGKTYECDKCGKDIKDGPKLEIHIRSVHFGIRDFKCDDCGRFFSTPANLKKHNENVHLGLKRFVCTICGKAVSTKQSLIGHTRSHKGEKHWFCEYCSKSFADQSTLIAHKKTHAEGFSGFQCDYCPKSFDYNKYLKEHIRLVHEGVFNAGAERKRLIRVMRREVLGLPPFDPTMAKTPKPTSFQCEECGKEYAQKNTLIAHVNTVHRGMPSGREACCSDCGKVFEKPSKLKRHIVTVHAKLDSNLKYRDFVVPSVENGFTCRECGSQCKSMKAIKEHIQLRHMCSSEKTEPMVTKIPALPQEHKCAQCGKLFKHRRSLQDHIICVHNLKNSLEKQVLPPPSLQQLDLQSKVLGMFGGDQLFTVLDYLREVGSNADELVKITNSGDLKKYLQEKLELKSITVEQSEQAKSINFSIKHSSNDYDITDNEEGEEYDWNNIEAKDEPGSSSDVSFTELNLTDAKLEARSPSVSSYGGESDQDISDDDPMEAECKQKEEHELKFETNELKLEVESDAEELDATLAKQSPKENNTKRKYTKSNRPKAISKCEECGKTFQKPSKLKRHIMTHSGIKPNIDLICQLAAECFKCLGCEVEFRSKSNIVEHIKNIHMNVKRDTPYKPRRVELPADLPPKKKQVFKQDPQICKECGKSFMCKQSLIRHEESVHIGKKHACEYCTQKFTDPGAVKRHIQSKHLGLKYECSHCGIQFSAKQTLTNHIKTIHEGQPKKTYICTECGKKFTTKTGFDDHFYVHNPHLRIVPPKKRPRTRCPECGKDFAGTVGLKAHMDAVHLGLTPYRCDVCGRAFGRKSNLHQHKQNHHSGGPKTWVKKQPKMDIPESLMNIGN